MVAHPRSCRTSEQQADPVNAESTHLDCKIQSGEQFLAKQRTNHRRQAVGLTASRKLPSFAVDRNCGIGSSPLNADVNAFDRLHMVRG
jgi:hypothetical protein